MSNRFVELSTRKVKWLLIIPVVFIVWELCVDFVVIGLGGDGGVPYIESEQFGIDITSRTDTEFVSASIGFLQERDSWQNNSKLVMITRYLKCSQVYALSEHEYFLEFRTAHRTTLLVEAEDWIKIEFINRGTTLRYTLEEVDHSKVRSFEGLDLSEIKVDSIQALELAELSGGEVFRATAADKCEIRIILSNPVNDWHVIYGQRDNHLCFSINPITGETQKVKIHETTCIFPET